MAQVPYAHIEAPSVLRIDGVIAFNPGDPVPVDTARRLGLLDGDDAPPIIGDDNPRAPFVDGEIKVETDAAGDGGTADLTPPADPTASTGDASATSTTTTGAAAGSRSRPAAGPQSNTPTT